MYHIANRIQDITVEIGGDTTKLTTALRGVNSKIYNTQSQLKDVEKQAQETNTSLSGFTQAEEKIGKFGDAATSAGKKLSVTAAITAAGRASAKIGDGF